MVLLPHYSNHPKLLRLERRVGIMGEESEEECDPPSSLPPVKRVRLTQTDLLNLLLNEVRGSVALVPPFPTQVLIHPFAF